MLIRLRADGVGVYATVVSRPEITAHANNIQEALKDLITILNLLEEGTISHISWREIEDLLEEDE